MTRARGMRWWLPTWTLALWVLGGALGGALGCSNSGKALTQIELTVKSDLKVPGEIDRVSIAVSGMVTDAPASADLRDTPLPRHLTLLHQGGPLGPVTVTATGWHGRSSVVERVVQLSFEAGKTKKVVIELQRACVDVSCESGASCVDGECRSIEDGSPAGSNDGGASDDGGNDAGEADAGSSDAGSEDAGGMDAGGDAGSDAATDAGTDAGQDSGSAVNEPPTCTITEPADSTVLTAGLSARFAGHCTDPESGRRVNSSLHWSSDREGALGNGGMLDLSLSTQGAHVISLCSPDPTDSALEGCTTIEVNVSLPDPPTASIDSVTQAASSTSPFATSPGISLMGSATGQMITMAWRDTFVGEFGTVANASLMAPQVGRHLVTLTVTDNVGQQAVASTEFVVLANGTPDLVQPFATANTTFATAGGARVDALAHDSTDQALVALPAAPLQSIYSVDGTNPSAAPSLALTAPTLPGAVRAIAIAETDGTVYFATGNGLTVCDYATSTGVDSGACNTYKTGNWPSTDTQAVTRARASGTDYLVVGTVAGLFSTTSTGGSNNGTKALDGRDVSGLAAADGVVWVTTRGQGLFEYDLANDEAHGRSGAPSDQLTAIAIDRLGMIWVGGDSGIGRYDPAHDSWLMLSKDQAPEPGLPSDTIRCLASARVTIATVMHDVIWVGSDLGVTRIDAVSGSLMNLTAADGLPSASVRAISVLADGSKLIATDLGLARYAGP